MYRTANSNRVIGLAVTTAMSAALLAGCATSVAPAATASASRAEAALAHGKSEQAVRHAEAAVLAEPRNAAYRAMLGSAYLDAGRFGSAATSFDDAMQLGDNSPRTALSLALALTGEGKLAEAAALLNGRQDIATADLGLALALAGQPERGIHLMGNAIRGGENTPKMRQNLAYAYALAGHWREARLMAEQDVPADKVSDRIQQWAMTVQPEASQQRVATLLAVPANVADRGQPVQLALANSPSIDQLASEATAFAAADTAELPALAEAQAPAPVAELPPLTQPVAEVARYEAPAAELPASFQEAFVASAPAVPTLEQVSQDTARFVQAPVAQPVRRAAAPLLAAAAAQGSDGTHLVQLGSFSSEAGAKRAWQIYSRRYPDLAGHQMVISEAVVRGKHYWRVSAGGYGRSTASSMCGRVRSGGEGCFAYAEGRPLPGAIDSGVRLARR
jgi:Flp pilus assembly protein TadD